MSAARDRAPVRVGGWLLGVAATIVVAVAGGLALGLLLDAVFGAQEDSDTGTGGGLLYLLIIGGPLWLVVVIPALLVIARSGARFRPAAIAVSLVFGSVFGLLVLGIGSRSVQALFFAWLVFGLLVPRPPLRPDPHGFRRPDRLGED